MCQLLLRYQIVSPWLWHFSALVSAVHGWVSSFLVCLWASLPLGTFLSSWCSSDTSLSRCLPSRLLGFTLKLLLYHLCDESWPIETHNQLWADRHLQGADSHIPWYLGSRSQQVQPLCALCGLLKFSAAHLMLLTTTWWECLSYQVLQHIFQADIDTTPNWNVQSVPFGTAWISFGSRS